METSENNDRAYYAFKRKEMKNWDSDIILYAKHWYVQGDLKTDIQKILAARSGCPERSVTMEDARELIQEITFKMCIKTNYQFNELIKRIGPSWFDRESLNINYEQWCLRVIQACLVQIAITSVRDDAGNMLFGLDEPDPNVLDLTKVNEEQITKE